MPRKPSLDGKDSSLRIRMSPEQKEKLVSYAERHYQTMSNVIFQALDILYAREEQQNKIIKSKMELFWSLSLHKQYGKYKFPNKCSILNLLIIPLACYKT